MKRLNPVCHFLVLILLGIFVTQCSSRESKIQKQLQIIVDGTNIRKSTPINDFIRFDSCVLHQNNNISYFYSIIDTITPSKIYFQNLERETKDSFSKTIEAEIATFRSYGVTAKYNYNDIEGNHLYSFEIAPDDYR